VSTTVLSLASSLRRALSCFEPGELAGADCARLAEELAATEKACTAARLLAAARAVSAGAHTERGFSDGAEWMARHAGSTGAEARRALSTAGALSACPDTRAALLSGEVSLGQAAEITRAESEAPGAESELLGLARGADLSRLRRAAREHCLARVAPGELHRRQLAARHFRHFRDRLGMVCFAGALAPEAGLVLVSRLEAVAERARREARRRGESPEPFAARAADALVELVGGPGGPSPARAELVLVCDLSAWRRGHAHAGEPCHLIGGGPVPVGLAREIAEDAFVKAVVHDGVAIQAVKHFGRHLPAELRTALDLGPVPAFSGAECADCGRRYGLEYDHVNPVANSGETSYENLQPRCWGDHRDKTERDRKAGLLGPRRPP